MRHARKRLICFLIGHIFDPMWCPGYEDWPCRCFRCERTYKDDIKSDYWFWLSYYKAKQYIPSKFREFKRLICKCDECGRRFCKRPNDDSHIPF